MDKSTEPIVCTLTPSDVPDQLTAWTDLQGLARSAERIDGGVAMVFDLELADRIADLSAREMDCCSFLTLTTTRSGAELRLEIISDNLDGLPVIEAITGVGPRP